MKSSPADPAHNQSGMISKAQFPTKEADASHSGSWNTAQTESSGYLLSSTLFLTFAARGEHSPTQNLSLSLGYLMHTFVLQKQKGREREISSNSPSA